MAYKMEDMSFFTVIVTIRINIAIFTLLLLLQLFIVIIDIIVIIICCSVANPFLWTCGGSGWVAVSCPLWTCGGCGWVFLWAVLPPRAHTIGGVYRHGT